MKLSFKPVLFILILMNLLYAKAGIVDSLVKRETVNAVPDAPAFNALQSEPSNILRPSDIRTIAIDISPFIESGKFTLPKSFALEISPGALIFRDKRINIEEYQSRKIFLAYNTTVSLGTGLDSSNQLYRLALGWRTTFINKADKFLNAEHRAQIDHLLEEASVNFGPQWQTFKVANSGQFKDASLYVSGTMDDTQLAAFTIDDGLSGVDSNLAKQFLNETVHFGNTQKLIDKADKQFELKHWNALRVDAAAALVTIADDSTAKNMKLDKIHAWFSASLPLGKNGQVAFGAYGNAGFESKKDSLGNKLKNPSEISASARFYAGVSRYKFFSEFQFGYKQGPDIGSTITNLLDVGTEISIVNIAWINLYGGFKDIGVKHDGVSATKGFIRFNWKLALPDYIKFRN